MKTCHHSHAMAALLAFWMTAIMTIGCCTLLSYVNTNHGLILCAPSVWAVLSHGYLLLGYDQYPAIVLYSVKEIMWIMAFLNYTSKTRDQAQYRAIGMKDQGGAVSLDRLTRTVLSTAEIIACAKIIRSLSFCNSTDIIWQKLEQMRLIVSYFSWLLFYSMFKCLDLLKTFLSVVSSTLSGGYHWREHDRNKNVSNNCYHKDRRKHGCQ